MDRVELSPPPEHLHPRTGRQDGQKGLGEEELLAAISANSQRGHSPPPPPPPPAPFSGYLANKSRDQFLPPRDKSNLEPFALIIHRITVQERLFRNRSILIIEAT